MAQVFLGVDVGTSALKVAALDAEGAVVTEADAGYDVAVPRAGWAESDPLAWDAALGRALVAVGPPLAGRAVAGLAIVGQMHGLVLLDDAGQACRAAVLWPDRRAEEVLDGWRALPAPVRAALANPLAAGMTGPVLDWLGRHEPAVVERAAVALLPKDYLRVRLGGPPVTDRSDASATLLWDLPADTWSRDVLAARGIPDRLLPPVLASAAPVGEGTLPGGLGTVLLAAGAGDTPAALLAAGELPAGGVHVNLGSGAQVLLRVPVPRPAADPVTHLYADAGREWYAMAAVRNAGLALDATRRWLRLDWPELFAAAARTPAGAGGVSVLPFLSGERGGVAGPDSRGAWLGLGDATTADDLARAAVEAMLFCVRRGVELLAARPDRVRLTGGGARHPLVPQLLADLLQVPVDLVPDRSASAVGAARLAAAAVGAVLPPVPPPLRSVAPGSGSTATATAALAGAYRRWQDRVPLASR